jgi:hypothetical protein
MAMWLLEQFGPQRESVIGDIAERFETRGHSSAWLWRQVLATIVLGANRNIREHKLLMLATVAVGLGLIQSFAVFIGGPLVNLVLRHSGPMDGALVVWPVWSIGFVATGAVISRMSRPAHATMVLLFAFVVLVAGVPDQYGLLRDALERSAFWTRLLLFVARDVTWTLSVIVGGLCANKAVPMPLPSSS